MYLLKICSRRFRIIFNWKPFHIDQIINNVFKKVNKVSDYQLFQFYEEYKHSLFAHIFNRAKLFNDRCTAQVCIKFLSFLSLKLKID